MSLSIRQVAIPPNPPILRELENQIKTKPYVVCLFNVIYTCQNVKRNTFILHKTPTQKVMRFQDENIRFGNTTI